MSHQWYQEGYLAKLFVCSCNEQHMMLQLVKNGPMSVSFEVYDDFLNYHGGIYHHTGQ